MLTLTARAPFPAATVTSPPQVEPRVIPLWFPETEKFELDVLAVKPPEGAIDSQFTLVQLCSDTATEALVAFVAVTVRVFDAGTLPLAVALNVIPDVLSVNGPVLVPPFTTNTTG